MVQCLEPAVRATETALELAPAQRKHTVWRLDGEAGSDEHIRWLLKQGNHVVAKGMSNRRAEALARQVQRWDIYQDAWLGEVKPPTDYGRPSFFPCIEILELGLKRKSPPKQKIFRAAGVVELYCGTLDIIYYTK